MIFWSHLEQCAIFAFFSRFHTQCLIFLQSWDCFQNAKRAKIFRLTMIPTFICRKKCISGNFDMRLIPYVKREVHEHSMSGSNSGLSGIRLRTKTEERLREFIKTFTNLAEIDFGAYRLLQIVGRKARQMSRPKERTGLGRRKKFFLQCTFYQCFQK